MTLRRQTLLVSLMTLVITPALAQQSLVSSVGGVGQSVSGGFSRAANALGPTGANGQQGSNGYNGTGAGSASNGISSNFSLDDDQGGSSGSTKPTVPFGAEGYASGKPADHYGAEYLPTQDAGTVQGHIQLANGCTDPFDSPTKPPAPNTRLAGSQEGFADAADKVKRFGNEDSWGDTQRCATGGFPHPKPPTAAPTETIPSAPTNPRVPTVAGAPSNTTSQALAPPPFSKRAFAGFSQPPDLSDTTRARLDAMSLDAQSRYLNEIHNIQVRDPNRSPTDAEARILIQAVNG